MFLLVSLLVAGAPTVEMTVSLFTEDQAARACQFRDEAKAYVCDQQVLRGAPASRVRFDLSVPSGLVALVAPLIEGSERRCSPPWSPACMNAVPPSTGCVKGAGVVAEAPRSRLRINWNEVTFTINGRAVLAVPGFAKDSSGSTQLRPSVAPPGAHIVEEVYQLSRDCLLPRATPADGDRADLTLPLEIGGKPAELRWVVERQIVPATERELFLVLPRPEIDPKALVDPGPWTEPTGVSRQQRDNLEFRHRSAVESYEKAKRVLVLQAAYDEKSRLLGILPSEPRTGAK